VGGVSLHSLRILPNTQELNASLPNSPNRNKGGTSPETPFCAKCDNKKVAYVQCTQQPCNQSVCINMANIIHQHHSIMTASRQVLQQLTYKACCGMNIEAPKRQWFNKCCVIMLYYIYTAHNQRKTFNTTWYTEYARRTACSKCLKLKCIKHSLLKGEFKAKKIMASNEYLSLIRLHILRESDKIRLKIYFRAFYLLIMIVQRHWFFANAIAYSMVGMSPAKRKHWSLWPIFYVDTTTTGIYRRRTVFYLLIIIITIIIRNLYSAIMPLGSHFTI